MKDEKDRYADLIKAGLSQASTADLIAELEKRRPCKRCGANGGSKCVNCKWNGVLVLMREDNFKEAK